MGQVLHGSATTTEAVRRAIQHSQESLRALSGRYGINQKTVAKWKKRSFVADLPTGPKEPKSTVLSVEDEAIMMQPLGVHHEACDLPASGHDTDVDDHEEAPPHPFAALAALRKPSGDGDGPGTQGADEVGSAGDRTGGDGSGVDGSEGDGSEGDGRAGGGGGGPRGSH